VQFTVKNSQLNNPEGQIRLELVTTEERISRALHENQQSLPGQTSLGQVENGMPEEHARAMGLVELQFQACQVIGLNHRLRDIRLALSIRPGSDKLRKKKELMEPKGATDVPDEVHVGDARLVGSGVAVVKECLSLITNLADIILVEVFAKCSFQAGAKEDYSLQSTEIRVAQLELRPCHLLSKTVREVRFNSSCFKLTRLANSPNLFFVCGMHYSNRFRTRAQVAHSPSTKDLGLKSGQLAIRIQIRRMRTLVKRGEKPPSKLDQAKLVFCRRGLCISTDYTPRNPVEDGGSDEYRFDENILFPITLFDAEPGEKDIYQPKVVSIRLAGAMIGTKPAYCATTEINLAEGLTNENARSGVRKVRLSGGLDELMQQKHRQCNKALAQCWELELYCELLTSRAQINAIRNLETTHMAHEVVDLEKERPMFEEGLHALMKKEEQGFANLHINYDMQMQMVYSNHLTLRRAKQVLRLAVRNAKMGSAARWIERVRCNATRKQTVSSSLQMALQRDAAACCM